MQCYIILHKQLPSLIQGHSVTANLSTRWPHYGTDGDSGWVVTFQSSLFNTADSNADLLSDIGHQMSQHSSTDDLHSVILSNAKITSTVYASKYYCNFRLKLLQLC